VTSLSRSLKHDLEGLLRGGSVTDDAGSRLRAARDWWPQALWWENEQTESHMPSLVVRPVSGDEVPTILDWANTHSLAVVTRGGGSGVCGAAIANNQDSIVLDTTALNSVLSIEEDPSNLRVAAQAGILGSVLEEQINQRGYSLMNHPASIDISTVGGWIATGSYGQFSTLYGGIEDQVVDLKTVLPDGSAVGGQLDNFLLSEGTLGVITEATLKMRRVPQKRSLLSFEFGALSEGLDFARGLIKRGIRPAVCRLYDPAETKVSGLTSCSQSLITETMKFKLQTSILRYPAFLNWALRLPVLSERWLMVMVLEDQDFEHNEILSLAQQRQLLSRGQPARQWLSKRNQWNTKKVMDMMGRTCFVDTLDTWASWDCLEKVYGCVCDAVSSRAMIMGHISHFDTEGACFYFIMAAGGKSKRDTIVSHQNAWRCAMEAVIAAGGRINHHHGLGLAKLPWKEYAFKANWLTEFAQRKRKLDPKNMMNPGKLSV